MKRVKSTELAVFSRQLSTMISSGMSILRALYVLEEQTGEQVPQRNDHRSPQGRRGRSLPERRDVTAPEGVQPAVRGHDPGRGGRGVLEDALLRVADQLQKDAALRRQIKSAMIYPTMVIIFAVGVMMALVGFLVPVFVGVFKQFGGELPALTKVSVFLSEVVTGYWWLLFFGTFAIIFAFVRWKKTPGQASVGSLPPQSTDEDRLHRPAGGGGPLVAHAVLADGCRRAAAAGTGDHRQDRRQHRRRGVDGRRDRIGQAWRHDRRTPGPGLDLPRDGHPHGGGGRGDGRPGPCSPVSPSSTRNRWRRR